MKIRCKDTLTLSKEFGNSCNGSTLEDSERNLSLTRLFENF